MIDLNRFNQEKEIVAPVRQNSFKYQGKRYSVDALDGWYKAIVQGNKAKIIEIASPQILNLKNKINGYVYEDNILFSNFDNGKRKVGQEVMTKLYLNQSPEFTSVEAVIWEDGLVYYIQPNYKDYKIFEVKSALDCNIEVTTIKGITPELKMLSFFYYMRQEELEELKKIKTREELAKTIHGRLVLSLQRVGAELLDYSMRDNFVTIDWSIGTKQFNSVIEKDTFRVVEAGYCMSGHDKEHTLHSMAVLAQEYEKDDLIYKTRE